MEIKYKKNREEVIVVLPNNARIDITDEQGNVYEIRINKFGGIDIIATDGAIIIEPCVSNNINIKTRN